LIGQILAGPVQGHKPIGKQIILEIEAKVGTVKDLTLTIPFLSNLPRSHCIGPNLFPKSRKFSITKPAISEKKTIAINAVLPNNSSIASAPMPSKR
jgi:hypothetical protein